MKLREAREKAGLNQRELAERMHVPQSLVSWVETGRMRPWRTFMEKAAEALGLSEEELFPEMKGDEQIV
ncbi:MAG: helix-turn-helix transcriptional regulator [Actinomycetota bacterium]|nr:helix-turn-helix transcriptional regulator [Actinomycetota bacterium]